MKCGRWKLLGKFHRDKRKKDGRNIWCKTCKRAYDRQYRVEHREKRRIRQRQYRAEHCEEQRQYRDKHREKKREYDRRYKRDNPDKAIAQNRRRRASKLNAEGSFATEEWLNLCARYDWQCLACGISHEESPLAADHVVPLSKGGTDWIDNIQPLCLSCNSRKGTKTIDYR